MGGGDVPVTRCIVGIHCTDAVQLLFAGRAHVVHLSVYRAVSVHAGIFRLVEKSQPESTAVVPCGLGRDTLLVPYYRNLWGPCSPLI